MGSNRGRGTLVEGGAGPRHSHGLTLDPAPGQQRLVTKHRMLRDDYVQDGHDLGWRMVLILDTALWAVDTRDCLMVRENVTPDNIQGQIFMIMIVCFHLSLNSDGNAVHIFHECPNFKLYNLQDKPSSFTVQNGGWVVYEKPNYMVKYIFLNIVSLVSRESFLIREEV